MRNCPCCLGRSAYKISMSSTKISKAYLPPFDEGLTRGLVEHMQSSFQHRSLHELKESTMANGVYRKIEIPKISLPSKARGITLVCTKVGKENPWSKTAWRSRESKPREPKVRDSCGTVSDGVMAGTSS